MHVLSLLLSPVGVVIFADAGAPANQAAPNWTDKEVLIAVGSTVAALIPVCLFVIRLATSRERRAARKAEQERDALQKRLKGSEMVDGGAAKPNLAEMETRLQQTQRDAKELSIQLATMKDQEATQERLLDRLQNDLAGVESSLKQTEDDLATERRRVQRALRKSGQTWTEKVLSNAPDFKALDPDGRRTPIVSVLNLKGGVGKTTVTANLGAALDGLGYRVLLLDLDLQGSLTGLFLREGEQERVFKAEGLLGDFLAASFGAEYPNLLDYTRPILPDRKSGSGLVPTTDTLAYAETNLTIRWLLRETANRDPRFLLRRELQLKRVTGSYDVILLDCPPLINVCCVNALGASDYLLVPVLPSKQSTARVPVLLERLKEFRENINPALKVMGVLFNRTHRGELTFDESNRLSLLRSQCKDVWGEEVPQFETAIRQSPEVRAAEDENRPLRPEDEMYGAFIDLAREVVDRLPTFCRPAGLKAAAKGVVQ
jgi:cellulose biosynthesis protein BcsQ